MIRNYLKIAFRNIRRNRVHSVINIAGLAVAISVAGLIMLYLQFEWGYDRFYPNASRIYLVIEKQPGNVFMGTDLFAVTPEPLGRAVQNELPGVESHATVGHWDDTPVRVGGQQIFDESILYATAPNFLEMFSYHFTVGDPSTALSKINTVVLSENVAHKFFGSEDPIGKMIKVRNKYVWTVTGVFRPMPENSQFAPYGIITSFDTYVSILRNKKESFQWYNSSWYTYLTLKKGTNRDAVQAKFPLLVRKYLTPSNSYDRTTPQFFLQPLTDTHLFSKAIFGLGLTGNITLVLILSGLALVILAIASINYMTLATARASIRAREVGVRKVMGAKRIQLIAQFMGESVMLSFVAGVLGLVLDEVFLPLFSRLVGIHFGHGSLSQPPFIIGFVLVMTVVGLLSGAYPALVLSMFRPSGALKGTAARGGGPTFRNTLVTGQFAASIALIACTLVILSQLNFIQTKNMGYARDNVVVLPLNDESVTEHLDAMEQKLSQYPSITGITASSFLPINISSETSLHVPGTTGNSGIQAYQICGDYGFLKTFDIPIVEGRDFSPLVATDSTNGIIINQTLENALGWSKAVGRLLKQGDQTYRVVGVMKDFNLHSLRHRIRPLFYELGGWQQYLCVRVRPDQIASTVSRIKSLWSYFGAQRPFTYTLLNDDFKAMYGNEERLSQIVSYSSGLAILIGCMGLFGLITFSMERRRKEIGIRKVLGATIPDIMRLLSSEFLLVVVVANIIAWPAAFYLMSNWLNGFVYRISLGILPFVVAAGTTLIIAVATVGLQAVKAATANPVESLRYE